MTPTAYDAGLIIGRGPLARPAYDALEQQGAVTFDMRRGIVDGVHEGALVQHQMYRLAEALQPIRDAFGEINRHFAETARWHTRYELTVSYDIGDATTLRADTEQECRNELAEVILTAAKGGQAVIAWNIAPVRELRDNTGIAPRNTTA